VNKKTKGIRGGSQGEKQGASSDALGGMWLKVRKNAGKKVNSVEKRWGEEKGGQLRGEEVDRGGLQRGFTETE